jgi:hypothetical protein
VTTRSGRPACSSSAWSLSRKRAAGSSEFYDHSLGTYRILGGTPAGDNQVQGYDCVSTGTQAMPPSWTNLTDPNVAFDTKGRVYQTTLPFNAFWGKSTLHPNGAIDVSYSDDMGQHWVKGNGGQDLEQSPNASARQAGHVEDKQWIAVNDIAGNKYQDHVYAMWSVFEKATTKIRIAVSRDRGQTFSKAVTITAPSQTGPSNTYIYPSIDATGTLYVAFASFPFPAKTSTATLYVSHSSDDGQTFAPFVAAATAGVLPTGVLPNTNFRDGITENFTASPTYPGHLYLTYEDWNGTKMNVKFTQSTDGGSTWSAPVTVNDNVDAPGVPTDQFQPSIAAGPGGAVAVAFYDRRLPCPSDPSVLPVRLHHIVIDAHDLPGLARFWTQALGWKVLSERENEIVIGTGENAPRVELALLAANGWARRCCAQPPGRAPDRSAPYC